MKNLLMGGLVVALLMVGVQRVNQYYEEQEFQKVIEYKTCILEQSSTRGWIVRSQCSMNYAQLDEEANLEYEQVGYDLYLKK